MSAAEALAASCAEYLQGTYVPRLARALAVLPAQDLWWRPHPECIAFGTILVHLEGNVRQWILSGILGEPDARERAAEFAADGDKELRSAAELLGALERTVAAACEGIRKLDAQRMAQRTTIQGFELSVQDAVLHVVEHFSWHTGQAVWIAKARAGARHGLAFYDDAKLAQLRNQPD